MNLAVWIIITFAIIAAAAPITGGRGTKINEKELNKLSQKSGLPLPAPLRQAVLNRVAPRERSALTGGFIGFGVGILVGAVVQIATGSDDLGGPFVMIGAAIGLSLGHYTGVRRTRHSFAEDAPRVARSQATTLADYATSAERWAMRLVPVTTLVTVITVWVIWALVPTKPAGGALSPILATVVAIVVLLVWGLLARARTSLVEQPQHAHGDLELAWDDALRSSAVREVQDTAVAMGMLVTLGLLVLAGTWVVPGEVRAGAEQLTLNLGIAAFVVGLICWALLLAPWITGRSRKNPSLSLWPRPFEAH